MKGLQLLLSSMGIKINPSEIEQAWAASKDALPQLAKAFEQIKEDQLRIEKKLDFLINYTTSAVPDLIGASNKRVEEKLDELMVWRERMEKQATMETPDSIVISPTVSIKPNGGTN